MSTPYTINVNLIDYDEKLVNQDLILHQDNDASKVKGRLITKNAFMEYFKNYLEVAPPEEIMAVRFNRHILLLLLAFPDCEHIIFSKALKEDRKTFTIMAIAVDAKKKPLGWVDAKSFASVEWGKGILAKEAKDIFKANFDEDSFEKFFEQIP